LPSRQYFITKPGGPGRRTAVPGRAGSRPQVDQEDDVELQALGAVDGEHAHRVGGLDLRLADRDDRSMIRFRWTTKSAMPASGASRSNRLASWKTFAG